MEPFLRAGAETLELMEKLHKPPVTALTDLSHNPRDNIYARPRTMRRSAPERGCFRPGGLLTLLIDLTPRINPLKIARIFELEYPRK